MPINPTQQGLGHVKTTLVFRSIYTLVYRINRLAYIIKATSVEVTVAVSLVGQCNVADPIP